jgi:acetyl esterase/lipase
MSAQASMISNARALLLLALVFYESADFALAQTKKKAFLFETDITYAERGNVNLKLNLAAPNSNEDTFPAIIFIHGGAWQVETKDECNIAIMEAAKKGYVAVTVDYRLAPSSSYDTPGFRFPAQVQDVKSAVRWLRTNASKYSIDPNRIGAVGWSAGAHLALMLGLTGPSDGFEYKNDDLSISSRVQAVVSCAAPVDLVIYYGKGDPTLVDLLGGTPMQVPELYAKASPLLYVSKRAPPTLTIHGDLDDVVPLQQAELLDAKMKEMGAPHTLLILKGRKHEDFLTSKALFDFLDSCLKPDNK